MLQFPDGRLLVVVVLMRWTGWRPSTFVLEHTEACSSLPSPEMLQATNPNYRRDLEANETQ